ncbi:hypothetical protein NAC44_13545 [Allorhizobium sp. BGMRC 0089]|uniref:hypothetical protein n=1 Tax=Allorhizobium sonneratiae TaxID=2934936 RepID=UPI0020336199|nr:hypothetical protein [Allorhizobium sonneratiae]MCM2293348.1 hypothetical protein [Allorhizobium sonneratiae]
MRLLTIVLPSRRSLPECRFSIETTLVYAEKTDAQIIVADNSADPLKADWLQSLGPRLRRIDTVGCDAMANLVMALEQVETPFLMPMADDDAVFLLDDIVPLDLAELAADVVAVRPQTLTWQDATGIRHITCASIDGQGPHERFRQYSHTNGGNNALYYSIYRSAVFAAIVKRFERHHPTRGAYGDWSMIFALLACGKVLADPARVYLYDFEQWSDPVRQDGAVKRLMQQAGLPENAVDYLFLLQGLDLHGLLAWDGLPLSAAVRQEALLANAQEMYFYHFREYLASQPERFPEAVHRAMADFDKHDQPEQAVLACLPLIEALKPGLGEAYRRYCNLPAQA